MSNVVLRIDVKSEAMHRFGGRLAPVGKKRFKEESVLISNLGTGLGLPKPKPKPCFWVRF